MDPRIFTETSLQRCDASHNAQDFGRMVKMSVMAICFNNFGQLSLRCEDWKCPIFLCELFWCRVCIERWGNKNPTNTLVLT